MGLSDRIAVAATLVVFSASFVMFFYWMRRYEKLFRTYGDWRFFLTFFRPDRRVWRFHELIDTWEARTNTVLTSGARQMLLIPIIEQYERGGTFSAEDVEQSLGQLFAVMMEDPAPVDSNSSSRSSLSVIKAFWKRFCNIPPFCSRVER